ncbi:MAG: polysaccharide deacetylase family protein [Gemmatimonadales bacterium]
MKWFRRTGLAVVVLLLGCAAAYGLVLGYHWWRFAREDCRLTPLMFHAVMPDRRGPARYWMPALEFARQMQELKAAGGTTPSLDSVERVLRTGRLGDACPFPPHSVLITVDLDGESHHAQLALPVLRRLGFTALFFVPTCEIDRGRAGTSAALRMMADSGMVIGSHTEHHLDMRYEQPDSMLASLERTRDLLRRITGRPVRTLSAPGGRYDDAVVARVPEAHFTTFFTSDPCYITPRSSPFRLCRIEIRGDGGMTALDAVRSPFRVALQATDWSFKRFVEAIVPRGFWYWLHDMRSSMGGPGY